MLNLPDLLLAGLVAALCLMALVWLLSVALRNVAIVDIFWGLGFVVIGWLYYFLGPNPGPRGLLVATLVTVWGLRLSGHLFLRNRGQGEDYRYADMRKRWGDAFWWISLFLVFWLQAVILWAVAMPLAQVQRSAAPQPFAWLDGLGCAVFLVGLFFESVGDWQLARFRRERASREQVMDRGLWRYTRHPNYFGDAMVWWGLFLIALSTERSAWTLFSPLLMNILLLKVSGVSLLEQKLRDMRPGYRDYVRRTNAFWPWFPRES